MLLIVWQSILGLVLQIIEHLHVLLIALQTDSSGPLLGAWRMQ